MRHATLSLLLLLLASDTDDDGNGSYTGNASVIAACGTSCVAVTATIE